MSGVGVASGHLWPICPSNSDLVRGYRIEFARRPPVTMEPWWTPLPRNTARRAELEKVLEKRAIVNIPLSTDIPGFYSPIFRVAKDSGGCHPILNLKAMNHYVLMSHFHMKTLQTVMYYIGEAAQHQRIASEHLRDYETSETWAVDLYQFERCLFLRPCDTRAHKISSLCLRWESVQIQSAPLRSLYSPKGIHKGRKSKGTRGEYAPVPRLAPQKPIQGPHRSAAQSDTFLGQQIGLSHEQREVTSCTNAPSGLPGVNPRPPSYGGVPKRKEGREHVTLSGRISHSGSPAGHNLADVLGTSSCPVSGYLFIWRWCTQAPSSSYSTSSVPGDRQPVSGFIWTRRQRTSWDGGRADLSSAQVRWWQS